MYPTQKNSQLCQCGVQTTLAPFQITDVHCPVHCQWYIHKYTWLDPQL
jgi:hypothetical protein